MSKELLLMTRITLDNLFFGHCVNLLLIVLGLSIFLQELRSLRKKYHGLKQSSSNSHNDLKKRWCAVIIVYM